MSIRKFKLTKILHIYSNFAHLLEVKFQFKLKRFSKLGLLQKQTIFIVEEARMRTVNMLTWLQYQQNPEIYKKKENTIKNISRSIYIFL